MVCSDMPLTSRLSVSPLAGLVLLALFVLSGCTSLQRNQPPEPPEIADNQARMDWHHRFLQGWQPGQGAIRLRPALAGDYLYAGHSDGQIVKLNASTGRTEWQVEGPELQAGVTVSDDRLYAVTLEGDLLTLDADTGETLRTDSWDLATLSPVAVSGDRIAVLGQDGGLRLWDTTSRTWVWIYDSEQPSLTLHGQAQPVFYGNQVIAGFANGRVAGFSLSNGELRWAQRLSDPRGSTDLQRLVDADAQPLIIDGRLFAAAYEGRLAEIDPDSGSIQWSVEQSVTASLATDGRSLFVANRSGEILAYDIANKGVRWQQQGYAGRPITGLSVSGDRLIATDRRGYAHVLSTRDGDTLGRINFRGHQNFTVPAATDEDRFYIQSMQGLITGNSLRTSRE